MISVGLWRWYINITITILNIIHVLSPKTEALSIVLKWVSSEDGDSSLRSTVLKDMTMDNVQNCDSYGK
jgi:hypothetical protein